MFRLFLAVCVLGLLPAAASAQSVRVLSSDAGGEQLEFTFAWPRSLAADLDSSGATMFDERALEVLSGGAVDGYHLLDLPTQALPTVRVLASDYDAAPLPLALADSLMPSSARALDVGIARRKPVATLAVPRIGYSGGEVRRYRRVVVNVRYAAPRSASAFARNSRVAVQTTSELSSGTIFRLPIETSGMYRVDAELLQRLGVDPATTDPNNVRVLHNGGRPVPQVVGEDRPIDLVANPVWIRGGGDGGFAGNDAVVFYAQGPQTWQYSGTEWEHTTNPYTRTSFVFLKIGAESERIQSAAFPANGAADRTTTTGRFVVDREEFSWAEEGGSGLQRFSNLFDAGQGIDLAAQADLPGYTGGPVEGGVSFAVRSLGGSPGAEFRLQSGSEVLVSSRPRQVSTGPESPLAIEAQARFSATTLSFPVRARLEPGAASLIEQRAGVDWLRIFYPRTLTAQDGLLRFATPPDASGPLSFALSGFAAEPQVWDVTDALRPTRLAIQSAGGAWRVQLSQAAGSPRELVAFTEASAQRLTGEATRVTNANLRGIAGFPDYVIVVPDTFRVQAQQLADHRAAQGLSPIVVSSRLIFDAFGGGAGDPSAIRDYLRFLYERAPTSDQAPRYVLLFGDGHFNYRGLGQDASVPYLTNWLPPYETEEALSPLNSFTTDDFFALLDPGEGRVVSTSERIDLGIGRLPIQSSEQATALVAKLMRYDGAASFGPWRNRYLFAADDALQSGVSDGDLHLQNADYVAEDVESMDASIHVRKVYGDAYERVQTVGVKLPEANADIIRQINDGILAFNYSGHGSPLGLASEDLFTVEDLPTLRNGNRLPIFITATCSFGHWDLQQEQSLAERVLLMSEGGGVAMFTTVRVVSTSRSPTTLNLGVNLQLNKALFERDGDGNATRFGDAYYKLKQTPPGYQGNGRRFNLLGDPAQRFGLPGLRAQVDRVNGIALDTSAAQVRALDEVRISGRVVTSAGAQATGFTGTMALSVYDAERRVEVTIPRQYTTNDLATYDFTVGEDLLWRGEVDVVGGAFDAAFVVSKDIAYADAPGQIVAYAQGTNGGTEAQAIGGTRRIVVGGSAPVPTDDDDGPDVELFLGDESFVGGSLTSSAPELIVRLSDKTGINTVGSGVGHELLLVVNGDQANARDIGSSFRADPNQSRSGEVRVPLDDLEPGPGTLTVRAWDVLNNATEAKLDFVVAASQALDVRRVANFPNPMSSSTRIAFEHNQPPGTQADVRVRIFTLSGQLVRTMDAFEALPMGVLPSGGVRIPYDGLDQDGDPLAPGLYLYQLRVSLTRDDGTTDVVERVERLAVVR